MHLSCYIFFVPLPLITIALVFVFMLSVRRKELKFDWAGYLLICITLFAS